MPSHKQLKGERGAAHNVKKDMQPTRKVYVARAEGWWVTHQLHLGGRE